MAEALVSNVMQQLATIIQKEVEQEVRLVVGVKKEVNKLSHTFIKIQAVLKDAEERQIKDNSVRLWLQDLKDVAYDIDDVLDEWSTQILKSQIEGASSISQTKKVCPPSNLFSACCFSFKKIGLRYNIGHRIKEINERVDEIASLQDKFRFTETSTSRNEIIMDDDSSRRSLESSSFVDVSEIFGRDKDKKSIISKLIIEGSSTQQGMVSDEQEVSIIIISIVGMAGMGKTSLAQLVFNDDKVKNHFNKRIWVHVSKAFDKVKVAMRIIEEIGGGGNINVSQGGHHDISWESVHLQLTSSIEGKHFLLVLDDVWSEDHSLWYPLWLSLKRSSPGSRIIVTTRNENVASMMDTTYMHKLRELSDEGCWALLRHYAFLGRKKEEFEQLKEIGMELAIKCKGLPLSAKTLGSLLHLKKSKQDWRYILESDVWKVVSTVDQPILPALLLSYNDLPSHLKQCFAYCSVIPRVGTMPKLPIIREWIAQGFICDNLVANNSGDLFKVGDEYFNSLVIRSFFQKDIKYSKGSVEYYQMHDLVYDFAKSLVENECFIFTSKDTLVEESSFSRARHSSLLIEEISMIPSFIYKMKNLRTLKIFGQIPKISSELFGHLTCLRTLDLDHAHLGELPKEIEKLMHLRYLNLSHATFGELPKTVTSLYNLRVLNLSWCKNLCKLPEGIGELVNLVDLDLTESRKLSYLPEGIGRLNRMRHLSDFIIGGEERGGCNIGELKDLNFLKGSLRIIGLGKVDNGNEAKMACLKNKQQLCALYFYFNQFTGASLVDEDVIDEEQDCREEEEEETCVSRVDEEEKELADGEGETKGEEEEVYGGEILSWRMDDVLESLQPHPYLEKLIIRDYLGGVFPNWMANHANFMVFSNLIFLELSGCSNCKQLPPTLGKLPSLETLVIAGMDKVKLMGVEFFGINHGATTSETIFPKLKVLLLGALPNLKEWDMGVQEEEEHGKGFIFMPCLQFLFLFNLPKLSSFPRHLARATSLRKLFIFHCPKLTWMPSTPSPHLPLLHVEELVLKWDAGSFSKSLVSNNRMFLPNLKLLRVRVSPYSLLPQGLGQLRSLEILDIRTCSKIKSIPERVLEHLTTLRELTIMRCPALRQRCQKEKGEDWIKISHIPNIFIDGEKIN